MSDPPQFPTQFYYGGINQGINPPLWSDQHNQGINPPHWSDQHNQGINPPHWSDQHHYIPFEDAWMNPNLQETHSNYHPIRNEEIDPHYNDTVPQEHLTEEALRRHDSLGISEENMVRLWKLKKLTCISEENMMKFWKVLFYYFWNCDKPLFQEETASIISRAIHNFRTINGSFLYLEAFLKTMAREWFAIDKYRVEKFMMLIRKFIYESFMLLKEKKWKMSLIKKFKKVMKKTAINGNPKSAPLGFKIHVAELYTEELARAGHAELSPKLVKAFIAPYARLLCTDEAPSLLKTVAKNVFIYLINQDADEDEFGNYPILQFDADKIQNLLMRHANKSNVTRKNMKTIHNIVKQFQDYKNDISSVDKLFADKGTAKKLRKRTIEMAALRLVEEESKIQEEKN